MGVRSCCGISENKQHGTILMQVPFSAQETSISVTFQGMGHVAEPSQLSGLGGEFVICF